MTNRTNDWLSSLITGAPAGFTVREVDEDHARGVDWPISGDTTTIEENTP